ncbi:MAG: hypothetical protein IJ774_02020 [Selenomonadaceae bacterium]|nr:hypothetical protein [Selenomonadaceae bacterium]MBR1805142.1 hypothetical protein [Selenomonadaceae bacterium]
MADTYNENDTVKLGGLKSLAQRTKTELDKLGNKIATAFKSLSVSGNTVSFFGTTDATGTALATFDFPEEIFLDQAGTTLVENFAWSAETYPGSTNPNLDGKTVLVLAVKGDKETNPTVKYSFVNLEKLIDAYTAGDNSIDINGYSVTVKISQTAGNLISVESDGLHVDISGKADRVANATGGNTADVTAMITDVFGA